MTKAIMGPLNALTYAPKLYAMEKGEDTRTYASTGASLRGYARECSHLSEIEDLIKDKFEKDEVAITIFEYAKQIEGYITSYGQHAAGIIALQNGRVEDYIPLICTNKDEKLAIQADMIQAEGQLGFLKFDFLGLKNLNVMTAFIRTVLARHGVVIEPYHLPLDDANVYAEIFAKGLTNFIFQFESDGMKKMLLDLKPSCFIDLVLAVSVYRPGPMEFIPDIIRCKNTGEKSEFLTRFPVLTDVLEETYGYPVFQEQIMKIAQVVAGWTLGKADILRRYMSKKNQAALEKMKPEFIEGAVANGFSAEDAEWLFEQLIPFAKYGFNKSHAAVYAFIAYVTAWAKYYYPAEYLCAAMTEQGKKTLQFISDCKKFGIEVKRVDINQSDVDFTVESENVIRVGLSAVKGFKNEADKIIEARAQDGLFLSVKDFLVRTNLKSNSYEAVILSGACDDFTKNRINCADYVKELAAINNDIQKCTQRLEEIEQLPETTPAEIKKKENLKIQWNNKLDAVQTAFNHCSEAPAMPLSMEHNLAFESEYLGMWTTGSPLEDYDLTKYKPLEEIVTGRALVAGVITGLKVFVTKNGKKMASFIMLDKESTAISAVVFPNQFEVLESVLKDNAVVEIRGTIDYRNGGSGEEEDDEKQLIVDDVKMLSAKIDFLTIVVPMMYMYAKIEQLINCYKSSNGIWIRIIDWNDEIRNVLVPVSDAIVPELESYGFQYSVSK